MSTQNLCKNNRTISLNEDLGKLSDEELSTLKDSVDNDIARIGSQISNAKAQFQATGTYSNPVWFQKAATAKKIRGRLSQKIQVEQGKRREERKKINREIFAKDIVGSLFEAMNLVLTPNQREMVIAKFRELRGE